MVYYIIINIFIILYIKIRSGVSWDDIQRKEKPRVGQEWKYLRHKIFPYYGGKGPFNYILSMKELVHNLETVLP